MGEGVVAAVLTDLESAPIDDALKAMLRFIEKLTLQPQELTAADVHTLHDVGLSDEAIEDAVGVAVTFNLVDRLADSLGWEVPSARVFRNAAPMLLRRGYK